VRPIKALRADGMPIGELSRLCGVNIETIRYYEKIKMLPAPRRTEAGHRVYGPKETRILVFIRRGRELGFTLDQIRALLNLGAPGRRHAPKCGRSPNITSKTSAQRLMILLSLNACCVRRSRNVLAGRHQIAPFWIFWMPKVSGHPAHSAVWAQARLCKNIDGRPERWRAGQSCRRLRKCLYESRQVPNRPISSSAQCRSVK
jgi:DNA-binding transcriptional MerR regulator